MGLEREQEKQKQENSGVEIKTVYEVNRQKNPSANPQVIQRQSLATSHQRADAQQVSEKWPPWKTPPPALICYPSFIADRDVT